MSIEFTWYWFINDEQCIDVNIHVSEERDTGRKVSEFFLFHIKQDFRIILFLFLDDSSV